MGRKQAGFAHVLRAQCTYYIRCKVNPHALPTSENPHFVHTLKIKHKRMLLFYMLQIMPAGLFFFSSCSSSWALQVLRVVEIKRKMTLRFYMLRIMPVGLFMALTLHFGNTVYLYLTVSFIQMLKVKL